MEGLTFRFATAHDAPAIARHRSEMFKEMGQLAETGRRDLFEASIDYYQRQITEGNYVAWLVCDGESVVAGGGMQIDIGPPGPGPDGELNPEGPRALIMNVYVEPQWRRRGIAEALMKTMIDFAKDRGMRTITLRASDAGRPLYEQLGFLPTTEMRLHI